MSISEQLLAVMPKAKKNPRRKVYKDKSLNDYWIGKRLGHNQLLSQIKDILSRVEEIKDVRALALFIKAKCMDKSCNHFIDLPTATYLAKALIKVDICKITVKERDENTN